jgi:hypothetical protein
MNGKTLAVSVFILLSAVPLSADDKKKNRNPGPCWRRWKPCLAGQKKKV